ncbi:hypothetical protein Tco_0308178 [Tanacetum coccineum]
MCRRVFSTHSHPLPLVSFVGHVCGSDSSQPVTSSFIQCYDPKLLESHQMALDAREGYIPLYLSMFTIGFSSSWEHALGNPSIFVDGQEMAFRNFMKKPGQTPSFSVRPVDQPVDMGCPSVEPLRCIADNDQVESSSLLKDKGVSGFKLAVIEEGVPEQGANVTGEGSKRRCFIMESLEEEATTVKVISKKKKLEVPMRMSARGNIPPPLANMHKGHAKLKNDLVSLKSKKSLLEHEMSKLEDRLDLERERDFLLTKSKEISVLSFKLKAASLEETKFVKDFFPSVVKKLFESEHFNQALRDLQQKAIIYGRSLRSFLMKFVEPFYKLEFPYISLLSGKAIRALRNFLLSRLPPSRKPFLPDVAYFISVKLCNSDGSSFEQFHPMLCGFGGAPICPLDNLFLVSMFNGAPTHLTSQPRSKKRPFVEDSVDYSSPAMTASYSASLLVVVNSNFKAYVNFVPSGHTIIRQPWSHHRLMLLSAKKSARIWALTAFPGLNLISCFPSSMAHLATLPDFQASTTVVLLVCLLGLLCYVLESIFLVFLRHELKLRIAFP